MIDIKLIRENPEFVRQSLEKRGGTFPIDTIVKADEDYRYLLQQVELLRARHKQTSKDLGNTQERPPELISQMRDLGEQIAALQQQANNAKNNLYPLLLELPNIPHPSVPLGKDENDNIVTHSWGTPKQFSYKPLAHWDLGTSLDIIDFARGVKLSGTRFYVLKGWGARLQRALISFMVDLHVTEHGYCEIYPPFMVKKECLIGAGTLPVFSDNVYHDIEEDFWFIPTAEVPLTNLHRDEILETQELPLSYVAHTACFRREKMAAGKDSRGIKRGHQFDKVELYKITEPEKSDSALESLLDDAEDVCRKLELAYRVLQLCTGDLGFHSCKTYDIEVWAPGSEEWLEVSSCSNCGDFQARRTNIRYRPKAGTKPHLVHTLNGSGLALPRILIAIMENYQQADGSILVPEALQPYMR